MDVDDQEQGKIRILCSGITSFDVDHMGRISFYPGPFFKDYFFPYNGTPEYRLPLIGIQFENLNRKNDLFYILTNILKKKTCHV